MSETTITRRDMLEACKIAKVTLQQIETDPTAQLALGWLAEKRAGETAADFETWLDEEVTAEVTEDDPAPS